MTDAGRTQETGGSERTIGGMKESELLERFGFDLSSLRSDEPTPAPPEPEASEEEERGSEGVSEEGEEETEELAEAEEEEGGEQEEERETLGEEEYDNKVVRLQDGTEVTISELVSGYMKDADYRRKTQRLAEERRAFEREAGEYRQAVEEVGALLKNAEDKLWFADNFEGLVQRNPWVGEVVANLLKNRPEDALEVMQQNQGSWSSYQPSAQARLIPQQQAQVRDPRVDELLLQQKVEQLRKEWEEILKEDPSADLDEVVETAKKLGLDNMRDAYLLTYRDKLLKQAEEQGYRRALREQKKGAKAPTSMKKGKTQTPPPPKPAFRNKAEEAAYRYRTG